MASSGRMRGSLPAAVKKSPRKHCNVSKYFLDATRQRGQPVHGRRHNRLDSSVGGVRRHRDISEQTDHETFQMKVVRWVAYILVMPIIWLVCGAISLWELITGKRVDFDGPTHRP